MIKPSNIQVWIMWYAIDMTMGQHHLTIDELDEAVATYKMAKEKEDVVIQPSYKQSEIRSGTPVDRRTT